MDDLVFLPGRNGSALDAHVACFPCRPAAIDASEQDPSRRAHHSDATVGNHPRLNQTLTNGGLSLPGASDLAALSRKCAFLHTFLLWHGAWRLSNQALRSRRSHRSMAAYKLVRQARPRMDRNADKWGTLLANEPPPQTRFGGASNLMRPHSLALRRNGARRGFVGTSIACLLAVGVGCQSAAPPPPTSAPAPTASSSKPTAPSPSPASSPAAAASSAAASPVTAASPKPAASPAASPSAASALASPSPVASGRVVNFDAAEYSYTLPDMLAAGQVTLVMRNVGKETHHAQLLKLNTGVTLEQFTAALQQGEGPALALVSLTGGTGALDPGPNSEEVTLDLQPGMYVVVCFIAGPDGIPHVAKGMLKPLQVIAAAPGAASTQPNAPVTITLRDFAFDTPADSLPSGRNTWRITNAGPQPHEIQVARLNAGGTTNDILSFFASPPSGPPLFRTVGGFQGIDANGGGWLTLDLPAGDYGFYCAIPDPSSGKRHLEEGMLKQVTVR